jgi:hypothetical protein
VVVHRLGAVQGQLHRHRLGPMAAPACEAPGSGRALPPASTPAGVDAAGPAAGAPGAHRQRDFGKNSWAWSAGGRPVSTRLHQVPSVAACWQVTLPGSGPSGSMAKVNLPAPGPGRWATCCASRGVRTARPTI